MSFKGNYTVQSELHEVNGHWGLVCQSLSYISSNTYSPAIRHTTFSNLLSYLQ